MKGLEVYSEVGVRGERVEVWGMGYGLGNLCLCFTSLFLVQHEMCACIVTPKIIKLVQ